MKTTVDALKGLFTALGGSADVRNISTIPDMIEAISGIETEEERPINASEINTIVNSIV